MQNYTRAKLKIIGRTSYREWLIQILKFWFKSSPSACRIRVVSREVKELLSWFKSVFGVASGVEDWWNCECRKKAIKIGAAMQYHLENFIFKGACVCMCVGGLMTRYIIEYADTSHSGHKLSLRGHRGKSLLIPLHVFGQRHLLISLGGSN